MAKRSTLSRWMLGSSILVVIVGVIHNLATLYVHRTVYARLPADEALAADMFFAATGSAMILFGLLTAYASAALDRREPWAFTIILSGAVYLTLLGSAAVATGPDNPFTFITAGLGISQLVPLLIHRRRLRPATQV